MTQVKFWVVFQALSTNVSKDVDKLHELMLWAWYIEGEWCCSPRRLTVFQTVVIPQLKLDISGSAARLSFAVPCSLLLSTAS